MEEGADDLNCETCRNRYLMKWIFTIRISLKLLIASKTYTLKNCFIIDFSSGFDEFKLQRTENEKKCT